MTHWLINVDRFLRAKQIGSLRMLCEVSAFILLYYGVAVLWVGEIIYQARGVNFIMGLCAAVGASQIYYWATRPLVKWFDRRMKELD